MDVLIKTIQVILALSVLIFIHELGHFLWARIFGIRVEKFYLFFDIGGKALFKFKRGETEFGIGWLPLGGYCKISGIIDESLDMEQLKSEPKEWEFRAHPAWHRLLVLAGGVLNNFIFAVLLYIGIMAIWGKTYVSNRDAQIYVNDLAYDLGFRTGDRILKMDDYVPEDFAMLQIDLVRRDVEKVELLRGGDTLTLYMDKSRTGEILNSKGMFDLAFPMVVDTVAPGCNPVLKSNDRILTIEGYDCAYLQDARKVLAEYPSRQVTAEVLRNGEVLTLPLQVDSLGMIGVFVQMPGVTTKSYNVLTAIPAGIELTGKTISGYVKDLRLLVTPSSGAYKSVGSFIAIGQVFPSAWDWHRFISISALLSIMLAVMNLLPIPGLDGGHIMFTLYEMITGRKPGDKFLYVAQIIGMILLGALMLLAFGNDIGRLIR